MSTPGGLYGLTYKQLNATLNGPGYSTPVSYWMPFNGGIGLHDATWKTVFGEDYYKTDGSHGCINLPLEAAATIYEYVDTGSPVVCYWENEVEYID
jgi:lipoprotein-anchoring transpeptidase ErfK/SrfK